MRNAHGNTQRRLPVSLQLVTAEVIVPVGNAVKLAHNALTTVLMSHRRRLLCGVKLAAVGKHVDSRQSKGAQRAHCLAYCGGLRPQRRFLHHMSRKRQPVRVAPIAYGVGKGGGKALAGVVVIMIPCVRNALGKLPDKLGQTRKYRLSVGGAIRVVKIIGPRERHILKR